MIIITVLWIALFIAIAWMDWRYHKISNWLVLLPMIPALIYLDADIYPRLFIPANSLVSGISCALVMGGIFSLGAYFDYGLMGMGDVKLVFLIGLVLGFPLIVFTILFSAVASLVGIWILLKRGKTLKDMLPLGAFLSAGAIGALLLPDSFVRMVF